MAFYKRKKEKREKEPKKEGKSEGGVKSAVRDLVYGGAMHGLVRQALKTRMYLEHLFMLITMGDMMGVPILPPYYSLRLVPYVVPQISTWKRRMLKERDITDSFY